jgi:hypothetical protein
MLNICTTVFHNLSRRSQLYRLLKYRASFIGHCICHNHGEYLHLTFSILASKSVESAVSSIYTIPRFWTIQYFVTSRFTFCTFRSKFCTWYINFIQFVNVCLFFVVYLLKMKYSYNIFVCGTVPSMTVKGLCTLDAALPRVVQ